MTPKLLIPPLLCILTSCASIMNGDKTTTIVHINRFTMLVVNGDTLRINQNGTPLTLPRSKQPVNIVAITDSQRANITMKPRSSFAWYANIFCNYGLGMLLEINNPKRYTYPRNLYLAPEDSLRRFQTYRPNHKRGQVQLHISLPHANNFYLRPREEPAKSNTGFWGLSLGLNYYHKDNQFVKFYVAGVADIFVPVPAAIDFSGEHEFMSSVYAGLTNNHHWKRIMWGYGISFATNVWDLRYYNQFDPPPPTRTPVKKREFAAGLLFSTHYPLSRSFSLGLIYRPTFIRFNAPETFAYEHVISFDMAWRIVLKK
jgi:hypothetical protein